VWSVCPWFVCMTVGLSVTGAPPPAAAPELLVGRGESL
jgi:hypothetical protein